ncbi:MAG: hypothetical protein JNK65_09420 [Deltaproteobacteria bacterium]|nr:hypothetical protein [Deltaproteobacteria bacterium]
MTKLTLRMDEGLIAEAKEYARGQNISLSQLVSHYLKSLKGKKNKRSISPLVEEISGILSKRKSSVSLTKTYRQHLEKKYR